MLFLVRDKAWHGGRGAGGLGLKDGSRCRQIVRTGWQGHKDGSRGLLLVWDQRQGPMHWSHICMITLKHIHCPLIIVNLASLAQCCSKLLQEDAVSEESLANVDELASIP